MYTVKYIPYFAVVNELDVSGAFRLGGSRGLAPSSCNCCLQSCAQPWIHLRTGDRPAARSTPPINVTISNYTKGRCIIAIRDRFVRRPGHGKLQLRRRPCSRTRYNGNYARVVFQIRFSLYLNIGFVK